jgi:hypothetical protein
MVILWCINMNTSAQDIPEPEFSQKPYCFKDGKLSPFENLEGVQKLKAKGMGYGGAEIAYEVPGQIRLFDSIQVPCG